jgi:putative transposase
LDDQRVAGVLNRALQTRPAKQTRNDPAFVEKVRDITGLYLNPPEHALVLCVDEKSQIRQTDAA